MYQALYRKWRPRTFDDVVGQEHITQTLKNQVVSGRLSHAYLFIGTRGTGKTTCAKILARAVNCENPVNGNPCNKCPSCLGIESGAILDVVELDAASNNGVDNVRELRDEAVFSPANVKKRVYIIDEVHMLSVSAFNALLKILEEPPEHLMFILATTELHKVPATILSRCQRHSFRRIDSAVAAKRLKYVSSQEGIGLSDDAAALLGRLSDGSMRDGLSLLDQCASGKDKIDTGDVIEAMGLAGSFRTGELLEAVAAYDTPGALSIFQALWEDGKSPVTLMQELSSLQRDIMMMKIAPKGGGELLSGAYDADTLSRLGKKFSTSELMYGIGAIKSAMSGINDSRSLRTSAEMCLIQLCEPELRESAEALSARIGRLEHRLDEGDFAAATGDARSVQMERSFETAEPEGDADGDFLDGDRAAQEQEAGPEPEITVTDENETTPDAADTPHDEEAPPEEADVWKSILERMEKSISLGKFVVLDDQTKITGEYANGTLIIKTRDKFSFEFVKEQEINSNIKRALTEILDRDVQIKIELEESAPTKPKSKLDALLKNSNITVK